MIHWLWAFLAFVVGEFVGLGVFVRLYQTQDENPKDIIRRNENDRKET